MYSKTVLVFLELQSQTTWVGFGRTDLLIDASGTTEGAPLIECGKTQCTVQITQNNIKSQRRSKRKGLGQGLSQWLVQWPHLSLQLRLLLEEASAGAWGRRPCPRDSAARAHRVLRLGPTLGSAPRPSPFSFDLPWLFIYVMVGHQSSRC